MATAVMLLHAMFEFSSTVGVDMHQAIFCFVLGHSWFSLWLATYAECRKFAYCCSNHPNMLKLYEHVIVQQCYMLFTLLYNNVNVIQNQIDYYHY
jgi:hypothetical protein